MKEQQLEEKQRLKLEREEKLKRDRLMREMLREAKRKEEIEERKKRMGQ